MAVWGGLFHLSSNSSPLQWTTIKSFRQGSFLLGRVTTRIIWVFPCLCTQFVYLKLYDWQHTFAICRIVCGFITGWCFNLSFPIWQFLNMMTWKDFIRMGLFIFHSGIKIGKNSFVTWTRVCDATTTSVMNNFPSLNWFGWVNVLSPMFRIIRILCKNSWCI